jgi:hypothetical protein
LEKVTAAIPDDEASSRASIETREKLDECD